MNLYSDLKNNIFFYTVSLFSQHGNKQKLTGKVIGINKLNIMSQGNLDNWNVTHNQRNMELFQENTIAAAVIALFSLNY